MSTSASVEVEDEEVLVVDIRTSETQNEHLGVENLTSRIEVETKVVSNRSPKTSGTFLPDLLQLGQQQQTHQDKLPDSSSSSFFTTSENKIVAKVESKCEEIGSETEEFYSKTEEIGNRKVEDVASKAKDAETQPKEVESQSKEIEFKEIESKPNEHFLSTASLGQRSMSSPDFLHQVSSFEVDLYFDLVTSHINPVKYPRDRIGFRENFRV